VARVRIRPGSGKLIINDQDFAAYFDTNASRESVELPLVRMEVRQKYDVWANVNGGGKDAQAGAVLLGISRALIKDSEDLEPKLRELGLLTRDSRMKERKKPGQKGARARFQFSKR
jgi:small subunit ribosomal protein S9